MKPEEKVRHAIKTYLEIREWYVKITHGNMFQAGLPDLYCIHKKHGQRWVEVKLPGMVGSRFTPAQLETFDIFQKHNIGVWVLTGGTETEYFKLFSPPNWSHYL